MSTKTLNRPEQVTTTVAGTSRIAGLTRSEWIKLRSLRSSWWGYLCASALTIGLGWMFSFVRAANWAHQPPAQRVPFDPTQVSLRGVYLAQLAVGVLAVVLVTGEYSTGMIRATLCASPRRGRVLAAKLIVIGVATFVVMTIASTAAFVLGQRALGTTPLHASLSTPGAARASSAPGSTSPCLPVSAPGSGSCCATPPARSSPFSAHCSCCHCWPRHYRVTGPQR